MNKNTLKERQRQKQEQLYRRELISRGLRVVGAILAVVFLVRGIILPIVHVFTGENEAGTVESVQSVEKDPYGAVCMPLKTGKDLAMLRTMTPGWHTSEKGRWYQNPDGTIYVGGFKAIDGQQFYFTDEGYLATGWVTNGAKEFYFDEDGSWVKDMTRPCIALTFDDGPGEYTDELLDILEENGAHATFFMLGQNVGRYPDTVKRMLEIGCEIGNHSWNHPQLSTLSYEGVADEINSTDAALIDACGQPSTVVRPPYGDYNDSVISIVGKPVILWCLDSLDWSYLDVELDYQEIMNKGNLYDGTIVLMHDIHKPSVECVRRIVPELIEKGYRLLTVSELAQAKNVTLQVASYTDFWDSSLANGLVAGYVDPNKDEDVAMTPTYPTTQTSLGAATYSSAALYQASRESSEEEEDIEEEEDYSDDSYEEEDYSDDSYEEEDYSDDSYEEDYYYYEDEYGYEEDYG